MLFWFYARASVDLKFFGHFKKEAKNPPPPKEALQKKCSRRSAAEEALPKSHSEVEAPPILFQTFCPKLFARHTFSQTRFPRHIS
jgi:hypothetical protein